MRVQGLGTSGKLLKLFPALQGGEMPPGFALEAPRLGTFSAGEAVCADITLHMGCSHFVWGFFSPLPFSPDAHLW